MIHDDFREAREAAGLSQSRLARLAGVARSDVIRLETAGENVTVNLIRKVAAHLPALTTLHLGEIDIDVADGHAASHLREALQELIASSQKVLQALDARSAAEGVGATRFEGGRSLDPAVAQELREFEETVHESPHERDS